MGKKSNLGVVAEGVVGDAGSAFYLGNRNEFFRPLDLSRDKQVIFHLGRLLSAFFSTLLWGTLPQLPITKPFRGRYRHGNSNYGTKNFEMSIAKPQV